MIELGLIGPDRRPMPAVVEAGSQEHIRIENAPYGCRFCGRDLDEAYCPNGCGHTWIVDFSIYGAKALKAARNGTR
jgi:hypothetical protein